MSTLYRPRVEATSETETVHLDVSLGQKQPQAQAQAQAQAQQNKEPHPQRWKSWRHIGNRRSRNHAFGLVTQAAGSASLECGNTKVVVSVYGPQELNSETAATDKGVLTCEARFAPFARRGDYEDLTGRPEDRVEEDVWLAEAIEAAILPSVRLSTFPKSKVRLLVYILEDDGSALATAITCASLAIADAGIELKDLVAGSCVAVNEDETVITEPTLDVLEKSKAQLTLATMVSRRVVTQFKAIGEFSFESSEKATRRAFSASIGNGADMKLWLTNAFTSENS